MKFTRNIHKIRFGVALSVIMIAVFFLFIMNQSTLALTTHSGFQNYETGKIYFLSCRITPSRLIPGKITKIELKNASGSSINSNDKLFNSEYYWDSKANIGAITANSNELETLNLLPLDDQPIRDGDGNYALIIAIDPIKNFDSELYKNYYFEIEYKVLGFPRNLKFMPFN